MKSFIKGSRIFEERLIEIAVSTLSISMVVLVRTLDAEVFPDAIICMVVKWTMLT